jgi:HSP20 family molecular chaperone IbpA
MDVKETDKEIIIEAELPGEGKDILLTLQNGVFDRPRREEGRVRRGERELSHDGAQFRQFQRSLRLPNTVHEDKVEARFEKRRAKSNASQAC